MAIYTHTNKLGFTAEQVAQIMAMGYTSIQFNDPVAQVEATQLGNDPVYPVDTNTDVPFDIPNETTLVSKTRTDNYPFEGFDHDLEYNTPLPSNIPNTSVVPGSNPTDNESITKRKLVESWFSNPLSLQSFSQYQDDAGKLQSRTIDYILGNVSGTQVYK